MSPANVHSNVWYRCSVLDLAGESARLGAGFRVGFCPKGWQPWGLCPGNRSSSEVRGSFLPAGSAGGDITVFVNLVGGWFAGVWAVDYGARQAAPGPGTHVDGRCGYVMKSALKAGGCEALEADIGGRVLKCSCPQASNLRSQSRSLFRGLGRSPSFAEFSSCLRCRSYHI